MVKNQAIAALDASNVPERALGVKRANLPDPDGYVDKLEAMTVLPIVGVGSEPDARGCLCPLYKAQV